MVSLIAFRIGQGYNCDDNEARENHQTLRDKHNNSLRCIPIESLVTVDPSRAITGLRHANLNGYTVLL